MTINTNGNLLLHLQSFYSFISFYTFIQLFHLFRLGYVRGFLFSFSQVRYTYSVHSVVRSIDTFHLFYEFYDRVTFIQWWTQVRTLVKMWNMEFSFISPHFVVDQYNCPSYTIRKRNSKISHYIFITLLSLVYLLHAYTSYIFIKFQHTLCHPASHVQFLYNFNHTSTSAI